MNELTDEEKDVLRYTLQEEIKDLRNHLNNDLDHTDRQVYRNRKKVLKSIIKRLGL